MLTKHSWFPGRSHLRNPRITDLVKKTVTIHLPFTLLQQLFPSNYLYIRFFLFYFLTINLLCYLFPVYWAICHSSGHSTTEPQPLHFYAPSKTFLLWYFYRYLHPYFYHFCYPLHSRRSYGQGIQRYPAIIRHSYVALLTRR